MANSSAAARVNANSTGRAGKAAATSLESGKHQGREHACRGKDKAQPAPAWVHGRVPICRATTRSVRSTSPIKPEARIAAASSADHIWMVWP